jgi:hypothetical protein
MGDEGYAIYGVDAQNSIWAHITTTPFFPTFTAGQTTTTVEFAQAYYFDYANTKSLKDPKAIKMLSVSLTNEDTKSKKVYVKVIVSNTNGQIKSAEMIQVDNEPPEEESKANLSIKTSFDPIGDTQDMTFYIKVAEFQGPFIKKLYLRDNLHLNYRKFEQLGSASVGSPTYPILQKANEAEEANGVIYVAAIGKKQSADNILQMELSNGVILLNVPKPDCCGSSA